MLGLALCIDIIGNVLFGLFFNKILITKDGYKFGKIETISRVLGINKKNRTLTKAGWILADILNFIDKDHAEKNI